MGATTRMQVERLVGQRDHLRAEMEALRYKIEGLELAIAVVDEEPPPVATEARHRAADVTSTIIGLLRECGAKGLNTQTAVEMAAAQGLELNAASVSSLLSRLKRDGTLSYSDRRYRLKELARQSERPAVTVVPKQAVNGSR